MIWAHNDVSYGRQAFPIRLFLTESQGSSFPQSCSSWLVSCERIWSISSGKRDNAGMVDCWWFVAVTESMRVKENAFFRLLLSFIRRRNQMRANGGEFPLLIYFYFARYDWGRVLWTTHSPDGNRVKPILTYPYNVTFASFARLHSVHQGFVLRFDGSPVGHCTAYTAQHEGTWPFQVEHDPTKIYKDVVWEKRLQSFKKLYRLTKS